MECYYYQLQYEWYQLQEETLLIDYAIERLKRAERYPKVLQAWLDEIRYDAEKYKNLRLSLKNLSDFKGMLNQFWAEQEQILLREQLAELFGADEEQLDDFIIIPR